MDYEKYKIAVDRLPKVKRRTGCSRSTIYNGMAEGTFPKPIKLGARSVGWLEHEIDEWLLAKIEQRDQDQEVA